MARKNHNATKVGKRQMHPNGCACRYCRVKRTRRRTVATVAALAALAFATTANATTPRIPAQHVWRGAGVYVWDPSVYPTSKARELERNRFSWVAVMVNDDDQLAAPLARMDWLRAWVAAFKQHGIRVCGWGVERTHPVEAARAAWYAVRALGLECYVADAEAEFMDHAAYGGDMARSAVFVDEYRRLLPHLPSSLSGLGGSPAPWVLPLDYKPWIKAGFDFQPQAYLSVSPVYDPALTVEHAKRAGWPVKRVHPSIGIGWTQGLPAWTAAEYVPRLRAARRMGARGFSVFRGQYVTYTAARVFNSAIARYQLADVRPSPRPHRRQADGWREVRSRG